MSIFTTSVDLNLAIYCKHCMIVVVITVIEILDEYDYVYEHELKDVHKNVV